MFIILHATHCIARNKTPSHILSAVHTITALYSGAQAPYYTINTLQTFHRCEYFCPLAHATRLNNEKKKKKTPSMYYCTPAYLSDQDAKISPTSSPTAARLVVANPPPAPNLYKKQCNLMLLTPLRYTTISKQYIVVIISDHAAFS